MTSRPLGSLPAPGERLGSYEILAEIAHGGMAAVYLARKRFDVHGLNKLVAIKVLLPHLRDREFVAMFLDEARVAVSISHAHVVQVLDVGEHDGWPYMVMEYLRGQPFDRLVCQARESGEPDGAVLLALAQAAAGLHAAHVTVGEDGHPLGIVHRDVTPRNIHVGYDGCTKIVDFGIAASRGRMVATRPNVVKGTLHYVAPELISRAHPIDRRADIWSFGVVAWEALAGRQLFGGDSEAATLWSVLEQEIPELRTCAPRISEAVARPIMACLQRDPNQRPRDLRELEEPLARAAQFAGGATTGDLSAVVSRLFGAERARDDERMQAQIATPLARPAPRLGTEHEPTRVLRVEPAAAPAPGVRRRWRWVALAGGALVAAAAVGVFGVGLGDRAVAAAPGAVPTAAPAAIAPAAAPAVIAPPAAPAPSIEIVLSADDPAAPASEPPAAAAPEPATPEPATPEPATPPTVAPAPPRAGRPVRRRVPAAPRPAPPAATPPAATQPPAVEPRPAEPRSKPLLDNPYQ